MRTLILAALAAIGLCLGTPTEAKAQYWTQQYYYAPNTAYMYTTPSQAMMYGGYYPYASAYYGTPYTYNPYAAYYSAPTQYYTYDWYNPYTNQYRTWRWYRR